MQFQVAMTQTREYAAQFLTEHKVPAVVEYNSDPEQYDDSIDLTDGWSMQVGPYGLGLTHEVNGHDPYWQDWSLKSKNPVAEAMAIMRRERANLRTVQ